jgi:PAS domain S-box-containing protein
MSDSLITAALRLAAIVESSDDAIVSKNLDGIITSWNRAAERMFGYGAEEIIGKSITTIIPPDRLGEETHVMSRIRAGMPVEHYETLRLRKDGELIPISLTVSPLRDVDGQVIGASKIARDISDRRRAEAVIAATEARRADLQRRLVALVAASGKLFGSPRLEDVTSAIVVIAETLIPADGYAVWRHDASSPAWRIAASAGVSEEFQQSIIVTHDGAPVAPVTSAEPIIAESIDTIPMLTGRAVALRAEGIVSLLAVPLLIGGQGGGTLVFYYRARHSFSDVEVDTARALSNMAAAAIATAELYDEQRRMREGAEHANRQAAFLAEASATLASSLDYEATLRAVANLVVSEFADWCSVDIVDDGGALRQVAVAHADPQRVAEARAFRERYPDDPSRPGGVAHVVRTGMPVMVPEVTDAMLTTTARDAEHLHALRGLAISSYIAVPLTAHGRTVGAITFVAAESRRRYTEIDLRFARDVAYRAALAVENARAYRHANAANRAKDEFLATLSHELRTPLNAVLGWARMLRAGSLPPSKMNRAFEVIERNAVAQLDLVEDMLDMSRIITGKFRLDVVPVDLVGVLDAAVEAVQPAATAKEIDVRVDTDPECCAVLGDSGRLQQAVWNLLSNAIKFTPRGGTVHIAVKPAEGAEVAIEVTDTGEGIEPAVLPYVFDRFRQGESGTTRTHMGLGLGLAIVRHIIELHGGRVEATSGGKWQGATFRLFLPVRGSQTPAIAAGDEKMWQAPRRPPLRMLAGLRALVVDDDYDARELVTEVLRSRGMEVTTAASAEEGLAALDQGVPDIILSDIAMPDVDGLEMMRRVRERSAGRGGDVPAVALTAYARPEDSARSLASGFQVHLSKPVDADRLISTVVALAGRAS